MSGRERIGSRENVFTRKRNSIGRKHHAIILKTLMTEAKKTKFILEHERCCISENIFKNNYNSEGGTEMEDYSFTCQLVYAITFLKISRSGMQETAPVPIPAFPATDTL